MEISQISFCNKIGYNITNDKEKEYILKHYISKYNMDLHSESRSYYSDACLQNFKKYPYVLSLESNGNAYYLLLITIKNEKYSIFIDTKTTTTHAFPKMIIVPFRFSDELYNNTIIKGSLIRDKHKEWVFVWEDLVVYKGNVCKGSIIKKYERMHSILNNNYIEDLDIQVCPIHIKRLFTFADIEYIFNTYIHSLHYNINGLIFHSMNKHNKDIIFYFNVSRHMKQQGRHIMNFERTGPDTQSKTRIPPTPPRQTRPPRSTPSDLSPRADYSNATFIIKHSKQTNYIYNLYCIDHNNKIKKYSIARIDSIDKKQYIEQQLAACTKHLFVECIYSREFNKWIPQTVTTQDKLSHIQDVQRGEL